MKNLTRKKKKKEKLVMHMLTHVTTSYCHKQANADMLLRVQILIIHQIPLIVLFFFFSPFSARVSKWASPPPSVCFHSSFSSPSAELFSLRPFFFHDYQLYSLWRDGALVCYINEWMLNNRLQGDGSGAKNNSWDIREDDDKRGKSDMATNKEARDLKR